MGREVRRVPADWKHPEGRALFEGRDLAPRTADWDEESAKWNRGEFPEYANEEDRKLTYAEWDGERPDPADYMPVWTAGEATHYQMYETCSEGSPISPVMANLDELAHWLADNGASIFGSSTATYQDWLRITIGADAYLVGDGDGFGVKILGGTK